MSGHYLNKRRRTRNTMITSSQAGLTLVELMISIALGLFVVMATTALLLSTKSGYVTQDEGARVQDTGRYAMEIITRAVRQAAFENWDSAEAPIVTTAAMSANIAGLDARRLNRDSDGIASSLTDSVNGSDVLAVGFFGAGNGKQGDGTIVNCAGFGIPAATSAADADAARGWSIFYVAKATSGVPELYCKYKSKNGKPTSDAIASGVESFQVLYGVDTDQDGLPNRFLNATEINASGATNWKNVVVIKVALLLRGSQNSRSDAPTDKYDLFGTDYAENNASKDIGTSIKESALPQGERQRIRKMFTATIQLRNQPLRSPT
jgi:type IV pilus assembly protein PilW